MTVPRFVLIFSLMLVAGEALAAAPFVDNLDGTVTDSDTGLIWQQSHDDTQRTWYAALAYCSGLSLGGSDNWRMPNIKELLSIVDTTVYAPAIDGEAFLGVGAGVAASLFWSSTSYTTNPVHAWYVTFYTGGTDYLNKTTTSYKVRCVR